MILNVAINSSKGFFGMKFFSRDNHCSARFHHLNWVFEGVTKNPKDPVFGNASPHGLIGSIKSMCSGSWKVEFENLSTEFPQNNYFLFIFLTATTWHPEYFWQKLELRNDMTCNRLIRQKHSNDVYRKSFEFLLDHTGKFLQTSLFYPSNRLFQKPLGSYFVRFLEAHVPAVRSPSSKVYIKVGLGISRTNADSQWNPVYNAFHRIFCCGNETIRS